MRNHLAFSMLVFALGWGPVAEPLDLEEIKARGSLRVIAFADERPEIISFAEGTDRGFHGEMVEGFVQLHRLKLELLKASTPQGRISALQAGTADIIVGIIETPERGAAIDFTVELLPVRYVVVTRKPDPVIRTLDQFRAARVGVLAQSSMAKAAQESGISAAGLRTFANPEANLAALRSREISAAVLTMHDLSLHAKRDPELQGGFLGDASRSSWGIRRQDQQLKNALNEYLQDKHRTASWSRLLVKYFGDQVVAIFKRSQDEPPAK